MRRENGAFGDRLMKLFLGGNQLPCLISEQSNPVGAHRVGNHGDLSTRSQIDGKLWHKEAAKYSASML